MMMIKLMKHGLWAALYNAMIFLGEPVHYGDYSVCVRHIHEADEDSVYADGWMIDFNTPSVQYSTMVDTRAEIGEAFRELVKAATEATS
jgi:hypothetical protein